MSGPDTISLLVKLAVLAAFGTAGAAIAKRKNRSVGLWFVICFLSTWIGLIVLGCMRKVPIAESASGSEPVRRNGRLEERVASDGELSGRVEELRLYGEKYITELESILRESNGGQDQKLILEGLLAKAKAEFAAVADGARLDHIGRNVAHLFRTARGLVAEMKDSRVLVQIGRDFTFFKDLQDYRYFYEDQDAWDEITDLERRRSFFSAARDWLEQANTGLEAVPQPTPPPKHHVHVWEWVEDCHHDSYDGAPSDGAAWTSGDCRSRVVRGGSWFNRPVLLRSAVRSWVAFVNRDNKVGFRVGQTLTP
jgi:hypothetical protein